VAEFGHLLRPDIDHAADTFGGHLGQGQVVARGEADDTAGAWRDLGAKQGVILAGRDSPKGLY
jgi:hypothetical protein